MNKIIVVNAVIISPQKELLVVKDEDAFLLPGGVPDQGETDEETLVRELKEELNVTLLKASLLKYYDYPKALKESSPLQMRVYLTEISGTPTASEEITQLVWLNKKRYAEGNNFPKAWWDVIFRDLQTRGLIDLL